MADILQLKTAKYKGVEFLFTDATTVGGNRLIKFNFPGSDKQSIERQGKRPRSYPVTIWIPHNDYLTQKANLQRVLEDGEVGVFTHPIDGDIENVITGEYRLDEDITVLGRTPLTVTFEIDDSPGIPQEAGALPAQVQAASDLVNAALEGDLADGYDVGLDKAGNFGDALDNVNSALDSMVAATQVVTPITENLTEFRASVQNITGTVGELILAPAALAATIDGLYADLNNMFAAPGDALAAFKSLFGFGSTDPVVNPTTGGLEQRKQNRDLVRANLRGRALSLAYLNAAESTYTTTDDLDQAQADLEAAYVDLRTNQLISNNTLELFDRLRVQAQATLDQERVNTRTTVTIETKRTPLSVLVYSYYGSTDLVDTIADLNNVKQNAFVEGELRILTT